MRKLLVICFVALTVQLFAQTHDSVKTTFQTSREWMPTIDVRADAVMVYGVGGNPSDRSKRVSFEERLKSWRDHGYVAHFMTGIAWGEYQDYFTGQWDGKMHLDEGQVQQNGDTIWHGHMVPYIVPSENYLKYLKEKHVKRVIDAGVKAIFMEEPEFWARAGYSEAFRREWKAFYGFDWRPQDKSPENTYLANKLKYHLYYRALNEVFTYAKEYGKSKGMDVKCYVPTHSLVNYSQWKIVSPEASLASLPCVDGYIAQVWTGTSREPNYFNGKAKERVFETAFLEYGSMVSMTAPTHRKLFLLTDPVEDWPRNWQDYKQNYEATFTAELLYPTVNNYEVMPWPERIYTRPYRLAGSDKEVLIPRYYSTQMQVMINALNKMPVSNHAVSGSQGISILMSNSLMFQQFPEHDGYRDPRFSNFYGQTLPLLKRGVPVGISHMENLSYPEALKNTKVLIMSYSNMKPMSGEGHEYLTNWVQNGGVLIYCGRDDDPYQSVEEWWNKEGNRYKAPSEDLFVKMGLNPDLPAGQYTVGKGVVYVIREDPKEFVLKKGGDASFIHIVKNAYEKSAHAGKLVFKNSFYLERGSYDIVSVVDEGVDSKPFTIHGAFIDLYDPKLPVLSVKTVQPGREALLFDLHRVKSKKKPQVLAAAARVYDETRKRKQYSFLVKSPLKTTNSMRILLPKKPRKVQAQDAGGNELPNVQTSWDNQSHTYWMGFENSPDGITVKIEW
ncbi:hypothetical protein [Prolixibacter sp. NT017]|uniref:hypothetical protein n=1 Tax=Prolixibacter sp. NT017 TaxID=2652390 RepID=UPI001275B83E|nr:hypothetical protein [Prolixibacter sp. NT017]GET23998.1 hypothetical protein NT017_03270 [Prolixibacter sp. NT017]